MPQLQQFISRRSPVSDVPLKESHPELRHARLLISRQDSKKLGTFPGEWNEETETRSSNKAPQFEQLTPASESRTLGSLTKDTGSRWFTLSSPTRE